MVTQVSASLRKVGFWCAVLATVLSLTYVVGQLAEWLVWLGSQGGPESSSTALGLVVLLTASLFLGSAFLVLVVGIHELAAPERSTKLAHFAKVEGEAVAVGSVAESAAATAAVAVVATEDRARLRLSLKDRHERRGWARVNYLADARGLPSSLYGLVMTSLYNFL